MEARNLSQTQTDRLHEVADLMLDIYLTLVEMRYLDPVGIIRGPHDIESLQPLYEEKSLDPAVIYLYRILPYVDEDEAGVSDFFQGGTFADFRNSHHITLGRDPFYGSPSGSFDEEGGEYIRPWVTPLSLLGNHQSVIIYDAREHRIWIIDQESWASTDLKLRGVPKGENPSRNHNNFEYVPSRPAGDVLRDINNWFRSLAILPGGEHSGPRWMESDAHKQLYIKHGWPDNFDGDAFEVDQARECCANHAKFKAEESLRKLKTFEYWSNHNVQLLEWHNKAINNAKTTDDEWIARYEVWKAEKSQNRNANDLKSAKETADQLCPGGKCQKDEDLPLWELEMLSRKHKSNQDNIEVHLNWANELKDNPSRQRVMFSIVRRLEKTRAVYQRAYEESKADAERLYSGRTFEQITGNKSLGGGDVLRSIENEKKAIARSEQHIQAMREWATELPDTAIKAKQMVHSDIQQLEKSILNGKERLKNRETWLEEHGNTN
jgi:hypothetical protein